MKKISIISLSALLLAYAFPAQAAVTMGASTITVDNTSGAATQVAFSLQPAVTASGGSAKGALFQQTLTASANSDALTALYINPTFADNAKTGVTHNGLIVTSGNVGIGTATPAQALHVVGTTPTIMVEGSATDTLPSFTAKNDAGKTLQMWMGGSTQAFETARGVFYSPALSVYADGALGAGDIKFYAFPSGGFGARTPVTISSGNLGVAVTPTYRLDVLFAKTAQTVDNRVANFSNAAATFNTTAGALSSYAGYFSSTSTRSAGANTLTNVGVYATASGAQNNYAAIFDQGNVGIGTTAPAALLDVKGHIASSQTTAPTASVTGTGYSGASMGTASTDTRGSITATVGAAAGTLVVTFNAAYATAPYCTVTPSSAAAQVDVTKMYITKSTTALTLNFVATPTGGSETWDYHCLQ